MNADRESSVPSPSRLRGAGLLDFVYILWSCSSGHSGIDFHADILKESPEGLPLKDCLCHYVLNWLQSCLTDCTLSVIVYQTSYTCSFQLRNVSRLCALLFTVYIQPLGSTIHHLSLQCHIPADTQFLESGLASHPQHHHTTHNL